MENARNPQGLPVTVVVVSFNTRELLRRCLSCLDDVDEVIVVDNASKDGSSEMVKADFPHVHLVANAQNQGFGAANNQGVRTARNDLILFLNSDAFAHPGAIQRLASAFENPHVIAAGGRLLNEDGTLQNSCAKDLNLLAVFAEQFYLEPLLRTYWLQPPRETDVAQVMGACLMIRGKHEFDERIFLYCEDTELCYRLQKIGRIVYVPEAQFTHLLGSSSATTRWESVARYNRGKEQFFAIHHGQLSSMICLILNRLGAALRLTAWTVILGLTLGRKGRGKPGLFWRVLTAPRSGPPRPDGRPR